MSNLNRQNYLLIALVCYVFFAVVWGFLPEHPVTTEPLVVPAPKSEIEGREDLQSRIEYEQQLLANPKTGQIPSNIRGKELDFASQTLLQQKSDRLTRSINGANATTGNQDLLWSQVGPNNFGGRTRAVVLDVRDENIMVAGGVSGGAWRSTDLGATWTRGTGINEIQSVTAITQNVKPGQEDIWYYGTGELIGNSTRAPGAPFRGDGIFKSTDNGVSWTPLASTQTNTPGTFNSPFQYVWDITTNPNGGDDEVLAAIFGGIVRSTDGGQTWETVLGTDLLNLSDGSDLNDQVAIFYTDIHRTATGLLLASLSSTTNNLNIESQDAGVYSSIDGVNWTKLFDFEGVFTNRIELGSSLSSPEVAYAIADQRSDHAMWRMDLNTRQVFRLSPNIPDGSNDIEAFSSQNSYDLAVDVHPTDPDIVFLSGTNLYRSTDGFSTNDNISWVGGYDPQDNGESLYPNHHPDQHGVIFLPSNPDRLISFNDGGIFISNDNRADLLEYTPLNNGFKTTQFYTGVFSRNPADDFAIGGTQDNGTLLSLNTNDNVRENGTRILSGDGAFSATTPSGIFYYASFQNSRIFRLSFNDRFRLASFARVDPVGGGSDPSQPYQFINPYVLDPNNANRMYLAGGDFVWRNRNLSQIPAGSQDKASVNWSRLQRTELPVATISAIQASTMPKNIVYYGSSNGRLFRIDNANTDLYEVEELTDPILPENGYIRSIAIDPTNADDILVSFSNYGIPSIFRSTDGGASFEDVSGTLEESPSGEGNGPSVRWVSIVAMADGSKQYYAATSTGLYATTQLDGQFTTWELQSEEIIGNTVVNMFDYRRFDGKAVVASHGRGMFTSQIEGVLPPEELEGSDGLEFESAFPNPFTDLLTLKLNLPETNIVLIRIYDSSGSLVRVISSGIGFTGENEFFWDGNNTLGRPVPDGIYLARITYKGENAAKRVILRR